MSERGFTLVEVLVAAGMIAVVLLGVGTFYLSTTRFEAENTAQIYLQRQATIIVDEMRTQIEPATASTMVSPCPGAGMPADSLQVTNSNEPDPANPVGCAPNCNYCFRRDAAGTGLLEDRAGGGTWNLLSGAPATLTATTGSCTGASPTGGFCPSLVTDNAAPPNTVGAAITLRLRFRIPETDSFQAMTFTTTIAARN